MYLDEPSGSRPGGRRQLWHAVLAAKPSKCIILTPHALEGAEALCDRVGIMTLGTHPNPTLNPTPTPNPTPAPTLPLPYPYPFPTLPLPYRYPHPSLT